MMFLNWLPVVPGWSDQLRKLNASDANAATEIVALSQARLDFVQTNRLDRAAGRCHNLEEIVTGRSRLAVLSASTVDHILPAIRVSGLRRGIKIQTYAPDFGTYQQALLDPASELYAFAPTSVLFALDQRHLLSVARSDMDRSEADALLQSTVDRIRDNWRLIRVHCKADIIQQSILPISPRLIGQNEHRLWGSKHNLTTRLNIRLAEVATEEGVDILSLHEHAIKDGIQAWHDPVLWGLAKQEITPLATPMYGELVARLLAARQGRSSKCLVLDLDNTLWGGVIGDDGLNGIVLGQGSGLGEAFVEFQSYARDLAARGVLLAVCSKNDELNALEPFESHPNMVLKRSDIACFIANWEDKATNIRTIARRLSIGLESLIFVDDNPFEREIVRRELPMVGVPELPDDPVLWPSQISDAGYFEAVTLTLEDRNRTQLYLANAARETLKAETTDIESYLASLNMRLIWSPFTSLDLQRIVQLINKTNQFNLMTRRYNEAEVQAFMSHPRAITLQMKLIDRFGDNGIIALIIGLPDAQDARTLIIDSWLMSCRVLCRNVEQASLNLLVMAARAQGFNRLVGQFRLTEKNQMVQNHYPKLGFQVLPEILDGAQPFELDLSNYEDIRSTILCEGP